MMDLLPAHSSPISMMTPEFYLPLLPSHCGQMSQLCFRLSPLGPGLEASELAASGPLITLLPLFEGRLLPFIPSCQLTTTGCDRIFQRTGVVCDHLLLTMCQAKVHPLFRELFLLVQSKSFLWAMLPKKNKHWFWIIGESKQMVAWNTFMFTWDSFPVVPLWYSAPLAMCRSNTWQWDYLN